MSGLERKTPTAPWAVRKTIPEDVRHLFDGKHQFRASTGTTDLREAQAVRDQLELKWAEKIARARAHGENIDLRSATIKAGFAVLAGLWRRPDSDCDPWPAQWRKLTGADPLSTQTAPPMALVIAALRHATQTGDYQHVPGLEAVTAEWMGVHSSHPQFGDLRATVAEYWLPAMETAERERLGGAMAAAGDRLRDHNLAATAALPIEASPAAYQPRIGDKTVGDLIEAYRDEREARYGEESTARKYAHMFSALGEVLGRETPIRSLARLDGRKVRDFLRRVPTHAGKRYRGLSLTAAIKAADKSRTPVERISQNTVNSYLANLSAMWNFAIREEWTDKNIASGLVEKGKASVKRRGFTADELRKAVSAPRSVSIEGHAETVLFPIFSPSAPRNGNRRVSRRMSA